jgi:hypothetical protein
MVHLFKTINGISNTNTLDSNYYAHFHSFIKYGIILGGKSANKKSFIIMAGAQSRISCRSLFKHSEIVTLPRQFTLSLINSTIDKQEYFQTNPSIKNINTRNKHHFYRPNVNISSFQKSKFYAGIKIFNTLPSSMTVLKNHKTKFKAALRKYLYTQLFYSVREFLVSKKIYSKFVKCLEYFIL